MFPIFLQNLLFATPLALLDRAGERQFFLRFLQINIQKTKSLQSNAYSDIILNWHILAPRM